MITFVKVKYTNILILLVKADLGIKIKYANLHGRIY